MEFHDLMNDAEFNFHYNEWQAAQYEGEVDYYCEEEAADRHAEWLVEEMDAMEARGGPRFDIFGSHDQIPF